MKRLFSVLLAALASFALAADEPNVTNTVMMVDQNGNLNVAGVASVSDVATNAVNVQIAQKAAEAASATAESVDKAIGGVVESIVENNVVVYRYGYTDSFSGLVVFSEDDKLLICGYEKQSLSGGNLVSKIQYVCTADIGVLKPVVMAHDTLSGGRDNFIQVADSGVSAPVRHDEEKRIGDETFACWYEVTVTIPVVGGPSSYFYFIKLDADTPSGDGSTLDLPNGVTGGVSGDLVWGDKILTFKGGLLLEVKDAQ